jgi:hypothetical protein
VRPSTVFTVWGFILQARKHRPEVLARLPGMKARPGLPWPPPLAEVHILDRS